MTRTLSAALVTASLLAVPTDAFGQFSTVVGGGVAFPTGELADGVTTGRPTELRTPAHVGWWASVSGIFEIGSTGLSAGVRGSWSRMGHDGEDEPSNVLAGFLIAEFAVPGVPVVTPFVFGGPGQMGFSYIGQVRNVSGGAWMYGGGLSLPLGAASARLEASWTRGSGEVDGIEFVGVAATFRLRFPPGSG
jgi:hypothetical protein